MTTARLAVASGAGAHPLTRQLLPDASGLLVDVTECEEPVLLGSAMLGAVASEVFPSLQAAMPTMSRVAITCYPDPKSRALQDARYAPFLLLQKTARDIRHTMTTYLN